MVKGLLRQKAREKGKGKWTRKRKKTSENTS